MIFLFVAVAFLWGVLSLLIVAIKTNSVKTIFLKKPSIIIGDFFILPSIAGIIVSSTRNLDGFFSGLSTWVILLTSLFLTLISTFRNKLTHPLWIPHLAFYWFMTFIILDFLLKLDLNLSWWLVLTGAIFHQSLGILVPKQFPKVKNEK